MGALCGTEGGLRPLGGLWCTESMLRLLAGLWGTVGGELRGSLRSGEWLGVHCGALGCAEVWVNLGGAVGALGALEVP